MDAVSEVWVFCVAICYVSLVFSLDEGEDSEHRKKGTVRVVVLLEAIAAVWAGVCWFGFEGVMMNRMNLF